MKEKEKVNVSSIVLQQLKKIAFPQRIDYCQNLHGHVERPKVFEKIYYGITHILI